MKKAVSLLASFALAFSLLGAPAVSFADEGSTDESTDAAAVAEESSEDTYYLGQERDEELAQQLELLEQTTFYATDAPDTGSVEVRLTTRIANAAIIDGLQAHLIAGATPATQQTIATVSFERKATDELDDDAGTAKLGGIAPGSYILRLQGAGFLPYSQPIEVGAGNCSVVSLVDRYTKAAEGGESADVTAGRGLLRYGDLNNSGTIDDIDALLMLDAVARVRAGAQLDEYELGKFSMGLVRETDPVTETGHVDDPGIPDPQQDTAQTSAGIEIDPSLSESAIIFGAGAENAAEETKADPKPGVDLVDEEPMEATDGDSASGLNEAVIPSGVTETATTTEVIPVGLNAFQMLASLRSGTAQPAKVRTTKETSHMQASAAEGSEVMLDEGQTLADTLFGDNGETVKLKLADETKAISEDNPVQLTINANDTTMGAITVAVPSDSPNAPTAGQVVVETSDGAFRYYDFAASNVSGQTESLFDLRSTLFASAADTRLTHFDGAATGGAQMNATGGLITVDLGGQIPVKTITIKVTATSSKKLAEIAQVEFLNGMEDKIPEPELDIPTNLKATAGNKKIELNWAQQRNVTGYEVEISYNGSAKVVGTTKNSTSISSFGGKELVNYTTYTLRARSTNGDWRSPWSAPVTATPEATGKPMAPAAPSVTGNYDSITVSWKKAEDAQTHKVYYKKHGESYGAGIEVPEGKTSISIPNLELKTTYDVVVTGVNAFGEGPRSPESSATTTPNAVKVPWYKLVNREVMNKELGRNYPSPIEAVQADYDQGGDPNNLVDGSYDTYVSGAKGGYYHGGTVTFRQPFDMDTIVLTGYQGQSLNIYSMLVQAWDASGKEIRPNGKAIAFSVNTLNSATRTIMIRTADKLQNVKKVHVAYQRSNGNQWSASTIAELAFYDTTLFSDTMALWADAEHTVLRDGVTMADIERLRTEANTADPETVTAANPAGEFHPSRSLILAELANAEAVCKNQGLRTPMKVDPKLNVNGNQAKRGVGGLNGWQPTGVAVEAGQEIAVYVGKKGETDRAVPLAFYVVQNHPEISSGFATRLMPADGSNVKVGFNTFMVPENLTSVNMERGGNLYVVYDTGNNSSDQYTVRVSGGSDVPVLDVHNLSGVARDNAIKAYVQELIAYDPQAEHNKKASEGGHATHTDNPGYDAQNCIANATDIVMNDMMYSIPVSAVQNSLGVKKGSDVDAAAQKLAGSIAAMEDMMKLFYQHKGFVKNAADAAKAGFGSNNAWPTLHQNIRYVRCSGKVFMYAAGNHVGIQWGSCGLASIPGVVADANGKYQSGTYFGWGVAHEIGHEINNGAYTYAEVTNNYYSQLAQATDNLDNPKTRWGTYDSIYQRVASGAKGVSGGKTGIAMYWQLHLAYDDGYNYKTYDNAADMYNNLVFARMDAYCRNTSAAPQAAANGHPLTMKDADKDNAIMRLACAATQKNLLDFFESWGLTPDAETIAYATQWPEEARAIQYQTDALRLYRIGDFSQLGQYGLTSKQGEGAAKNARVTASLVYTPSTDGRANTTQDQTIRVQLTGASTGSEILGYEVLRNGQVVGFLRANDFEDCPGEFENGTATFSDTINTVNNRVFKYEVRAVDKLLARGDLIPAGEVKVSHKNSLAKTKWTATTNLVSGGVLPNETHTVTVGTGDNAIVYDAEEYATEDDETANHPVAKVIDNNVSTVFTGALPSGTTESDSRITIDFGETLTVVGLQAIGAPVGAAYQVQTSPDGETWNTVKTGVFDGADAIYFERAGDQYLYGHDAARLRLVLPGQTGVTLSEINVLGPQGDDAEFLANGIGVLDQTEKLGTGESGKEATIPAGSLVFIGTYKGNPAFNALLLYDQDGNILGGIDDDGAIHAKEVIFAPPVAEDAMLGDVKEGYWVYYIEPQYLASDWRSRITSVKAELYRVDDAHTLEGQRLVADTLSVALPADLSKIDLSFGQVKTADAQATDVQTEQRTQNGAAVGAEASPMEQPAADAISGYSYDLADVYGTAPTANADQSNVLGTPIYGSTIDQSTFAGEPIYGSGGASEYDPALGTPIYDTATPLASPNHENGALGNVTLKSRREALVEVLKQLDDTGAVKNLR